MKKGKKYLVRTINLSNDESENSLKNDDFLKRVNKYQKKVTKLLLKYNMELITYTYEIGDKDLNKILFPKNEKELDVLNRCLIMYEAIRDHVGSRTDFYADNYVNRAYKLAYSEILGEEKEGTTEKFYKEICSNLITIGKLAVDNYEYRNYPYTSTEVEYYLGEGEKLGINFFKFIYLLLSKTTISSLKATCFAIKNDPIIAKYYKQLYFKHGVEKYALNYDIIMAYINSLEVKKNEKQITKSRKKK